MRFRQSTARGASTVMLILAVVSVAANQLPAVSAVLTSSQARAGYLARATVWREPGSLTPEQLLAGPPGIFPYTFAEATAEAGIRCMFAKPGRELGGNSLKFSCTAGDGRALRVKYWDPALQAGNREVFASVAASRLMWALGFETIHALPLNLQCTDCPQNPMSGEGARQSRVYLAQLQEFPTGRPTILSRHDRDQGWSWREIDDAINGLRDASERLRQRTHFDALMLLGVLMQHGDRKPEQQALYCEGPVDPAAGRVQPWDREGPALMLRESPGAAACARAAAMVFDLGATFGGAGRTSSADSAKMNLEEWRGKPVFKDSEEGACRGRLTVSLTAGRDGLGDPVISEQGRRFLLQQLQRLSPPHVRAIFAAARVDRMADTVPQPADGASASAIDAWVAAFHEKVQQIDAQRCQPAA